MLKWHEFSTLFIVVVSKIDDFPSFPSAILPRSVTGAVDISVPPVTGRNKQKSCDAKRIKAIARKLLGIPLLITMKYVLFLRVLEY